MEALLIYILKSSGLLAGFFLVYHLLLRKDTFFNLSRWYLMGGLILSLVLPLFEIRKVVIVPKPTLTVDDLIAMSQPAEAQYIPMPVTSVADSTNWFEIALYGYMFVAACMLLIVLLNLFSLWKLLYRQEIIRRDKFALVDLDKRVAPFSFFRYIVFNSSLYTPGELDSILNHEKVHSEQHHTIDVLLVRLVCVIFWFNPFVWLYRKAIAQNLEYIADQKAVCRSNDKKAYQIALLKVGASTNTLSITNPFYQSLIKKRIVMLNKEQSKKRNLLKYALAVPMILAFMLYFQVKVVAQTPEAPEVPGNATTRIYKVQKGTPVVIDKNTTDSDLKKKAAKLKEEGVTLKVSKVKRNKQGEITGIKLAYKDHNGNETVSQIKGNEPIKPLHIFAKDGRLNFSTSGGGIVASAADVLKNMDLSNMDLDFEGVFNINMDGEDIEIEIPDVPDAPPLPEGSVSAPAPPDAPGSPKSKTKKIVIRNGENFIAGQKFKTLNSNPLIIVNGKVIGNGEKFISGLNPSTISSVQVMKDKETIAKYGAKAKDGVIMISTEDMHEMVDMESIKSIQSSAMKIAQEALAKAGKEMGDSDSELATAKIEMAKAKEEMLQAKKEMEAAKAEYEKAKREIKKP